MNRFRFTLLAFCLVLGYLGWTDLSLMLNNPHPLRISAQELAENGPPQQWLEIAGGEFLLTEAISTSGSIELDALLVPLVAPGISEGRILVETRRPGLLETFRTYHFTLDSPLEKKAYLDEHRQAFSPEVTVTGMLMSGRIAQGNREKLLELAEQTNVAVSEETLLFTEGREPAKLRGIFFSVMALLGIGRFIQLQRRKSRDEA